MHPYLRETGLTKDAFSDFKEEKITFLSETDARLYIEGLLLNQGILLPESIIDKLVKMNTPGIPYFIQIIITQMATAYRQYGKLDENDIESIYYRQVIGPDARRYFDTFKRHFERYGTRKVGAKEILKALSDVDDKGIERKTLYMIFKRSYSSGTSKEFDILLKNLEYDFFIEKIKGSNQYRFASPVLRDYWRKNQ